MASGKPTGDDDEWESVPSKKTAGAATATSDEWEDVPSSAAAVAPTEEDLPSSTPRLRAAAKSFRPPTRVEKETPKIPENYGFTPGNVLGNIYEGAKGAIGSAAQGVYDLALGQGKDESGQEVHGLGGLVGLNPKGEFDPAGRVKWLGEKYITDPYKQESEKARQLEEQSRQEEASGAPGSVGHATSAVGHRIASMVPLVGPFAASLGEQAGTGDVGGAAGQAGGAVLGGELAAHPIEAAKVVGKVGDKVIRGTPVTEAGKRQAAMKQAMVVKKPSMNETEYATKIQVALPELQRIARENPDIKTPRDEVQAINNRVKQIEAPIAHHLDQVPDAQQMVPAQSWIPNVDQAMDQAFTSKGRGHFSPEETEKAKQAVWKFIGDQDKPAAVMEGNRRRLNELADDYYHAKTAGKQAIDIGDATAVAQRAAANAMRDHLYGDGVNPGILEQSGVTAADTSGQPMDIRHVRRTVGNLLDIRDHFEDAINKAEETGDWKPWSKAHIGPSVAAGGLGLAAGSLAGHPLLGILAGEGVKAWGDYLRSKNPNLNTVKMNRNLRGLPGAPTAEIRAQLPPVLGANRALPAPATAATPMPGPADLSGSVRGGRYTTPAGALPAPAPIAPQFVREIPPMRAPQQPGPPPRLPEAAASRVPPETNIPPMTEPEFAREEVQPGTTELAPERQLGPVGRGGIRTTPAAELPKIARSHVVQDKIDRLKLEESDLRRAGNSGAANAKKVARLKLEAQVPAGFEETPPQRPKVAGETTLGKIGRKIGGEAKRLAKEEEGTLDLGRLGKIGEEFSKKKEELGNLYTVEGSKELADKIGAKVVGSVAKGKKTPGDLDLRIEGKYDNDVVEKSLKDAGFEHYGSQLVGPKEAKASKKVYAPGWNRAEYFEDSKGRKVEVWHDAEEATKGEEEPGPLRGMVQDKDAAARVNRKLNRKEGIGDPKSPALVVHDDEGKPYVFGNANADQLLDKWQAHLDPDTIKTWREWYPDIGKQFEQAYGKGKQAASKMMAWLGSQQNTSPSGGLMNVERATDILSGQRKIKSAGIAENNIMSMLQGKVPEGGYGAKLHDFVDSALGRKSRTVMGDDTRAGSPAVVDVHGARGMGFVDQTLKDFVAKKFGQEAANKLTVDLSGAPTETQYEHGSEKMNRIADELNKREFMGGGWTPDQVQAVDWAATIKQLGREPELPNSIFDKNTRRMSYEVKFGENSPYSKRFPNLGDLDYAKSMGITKDVAQHAMKLISKEAGGHVLRNVYGPGGWMESVSPSAGTEVLASPESAERATNMLGYLLQQDAVITSRPQLSGGGHFYEVVEPGGDSLRNPEKVTQFWNAFREAYPKAEGFMPVETPDGAGIRILKVRGHFSAKDVAALNKAASEAADRVKIGAVDTTDGPADIYMASNDWKAHPDGKGYLQRIKEIGRSGIQGRLRNELAPAVERAIQQAFKKHASEQTRGGAAPTTQAGKKLAAK